jgi:excisionase family DNA binding protein
VGLITVQEAAARLKVTSKAIYYALTEGNLTRHEQYGRILVDEEEVARYKPIAGGSRPSKRRKNQPPLEQK